MWAPWPIRKKRALGSACSWSHTWPFASENDTMFGRTSCRVVIWEISSLSFADMVGRSPGGSSSLPNRASGDCGGDDCADPAADPAAAASADAGDETDGDGGLGCDASADVGLRE